MKGETFNSLIDEIKRGGQPCTCGEYMTWEQIQTVKNVYTADNRTLDDYFTYCIEARLCKKQYSASPDMDGLACARLVHEMKGIIRKHHRILRFEELSAKHCTIIMIVLIIFQILILAQSFLML